MTQDECLDVVREIERQFPVETWTIGGINIWPFWRMQAFYELFCRDRGTGSDKGGGLNTNKTRWGVATAFARGFLRFRALATRIGAVLIFDEVTSGFRMNVGGIHLQYKVQPDIAVFGKALGNGYPIAAIVGRREVMECAQSTFISSTFWTERIGYAAALATIEKMQANDVPVSLVQYGARISAGWRGLALRHGLKISVSGIPPLTHLSFQGDDPLAAQTLYAQEMLGLGFLAGAAVYTTYAYSDAIIDKYIAASDGAFATIRKAIESGDVRSWLKGEVIDVGFKRLNA